MKIWFYKPWMENPKIRESCLFDIKGKKYDAVPPEKKYPMDRIYRPEIKSSMMEVPDK